MKKYQEKKNSGRRIKDHLLAASPKKYQTKCVPNSRLSNI